MKKALSTTIKDKFLYIGWLLGCVIASIKPANLAFVTRSVTLKIKENFGFNLAIAAALLLTLSGGLSAQTPTLIGQYTYTTKGSGSTGVPSFSYNIPAGKNRMMIVAAHFERDHITQGANFPGANGDAIPPLNLGSANLNTTSYNFTTMDLQVVYNPQLFSVIRFFIIGSLMRIYPWETLIFHSLRLLPSPLRLKVMT